MAVAVCDVQGGSNVQGGVFFLCKHGNLFA